MTVSNGANSRLRTIDWSINAAATWRFQPRRLGGHSRLCCMAKTWRFPSGIRHLGANFGRTTATGYQALSADVSVDDSIPELIVEANVLEVADDESVETIDNP